MVKRITMISAGVNPASSSTFDETNVAPHTMAVNMAARWYIDFGFISLSDGVHADACLDKR